MPELSRRRPGEPGRLLRVVVLGSSTAFMVVPRPASWDDAPWPALLEGALLDRGVHARVDLHARWFAHVLDLLPRFEQWVRDAAPDVVVLNIGYVDAQPRVVPTWFARHVTTWEGGLRRSGQIYRRRVVPPLRSAAREVQRRTAPRAGLRASRVPPALFERAVQRLARLCVREIGAVVVLLDIDPVSDRIEHFMPGMRARTEHYNGILRRVAATPVDGRGWVVALPTSEVVRADPELLLPDGVHRSPEGHRRVAVRVADAIVQEIRRMQPGAPTGEQVTA